MKLFFRGLSAAIPCPVVFLLALLLLSGCRGNAAYPKDIEKQLEELDQVIRQRDIYLQEKLQLIENTREERTSVAQAERMAALYRGFQCDSLLRYCRESVLLYQESGDTSGLVKAELSLAYILTKSGMYDEAHLVLSSVRARSMSDEQKAYYYWLNYLLYNNKSYLTKDRYLDRTYFQPKAREYKDSLDGYIDQAGEYRYSILANMYLHSRDYPSLIRLSEEQLAGLSPRQMRDAASIWYNIGEAKRQLGDSNGAMEALIQSAKNDMEYVIKDHASLHQIARELYAKGDLNRAARYMQLCMEDAQYYNANLRGLQLGSTMPVIMDSYSRNNKKQIRGLGILSGIAILLLILSLSSFFLLLRERNELAKTQRDLRQANERLNRINDELTESNFIKENYVAHFIQQNSDHIYKTHDYLTRINGAIRKGNKSEALALSSVPDYDEEQLNDFYQAFDSAFLSIFPDFIEKFNALVKEEYRYPLEQFDAPKPSLTSELRVFALIRLGFNDSPTLANMLRYSVNSIYNIRSKAKSKSNVPKEDFERRIKEIGLNHD